MLNSFFSNPLYFLISIIALFIAITIHEFAHAWMADHLGDPTPRLAGRLTLNPLAHIDIFGLLFLFVSGFGWGKPVPFDAFNLKNPKKDAALISLAGPFSNLILALILSLLIRLFILFKLSFFIAIGYLLLPVIYLNIILAIFNLLPVSPLDGFKIFGGLLPDEKAQEWYQLERYGFIFLLLLILPIGRSSMLDMIIKPVIDFLFQLSVPSFTVAGAGII